MYRKKDINIGKSKFSPSSKFEEDREYREFKELYSKVKKRYGLTAVEIITELEKEEILIPDCVFSQELSAFESIVKYLKENLGFTNKKIAELTSKSQKSIWQSYNSAKKKSPALFEITDSEHHIPVSALKPPFTILESIVRFLKEEQNLRFHQIAAVLKRDDRTVWTVYRRTMKRNE